MLKFIVTNQNITLEKSTPLGNPLVSNSAGEYKCFFDFDETWDGFIKTAIFVTSGNELYNKHEIFTEPVLLENDICTIPQNSLKPDSILKVGVYGVKNEIQRPTIFTPWMLIRTGAVPDSNMPSPPSSIYLQIIKIMEETKEIAQSVRNDADNGEFDGQGVPVGGKTGQVLIKKSDKDYDTEWSGSSTGVLSWNKRIGNVVPKDNDYSYEQIKGLEEELLKARHGETFIYKQRSPALVWTIVHNLNKFPSVTIVDSAGTIIIGEIHYLDKNSLEVSFLSKFGGVAFLN